MTSVNNIEFVAPTFKIHCFAKEIISDNYLFQVIKMKESVIIFINKKDHRTLDELSLALPSRFDDTPLGTKLFGNFTEDVSKSMAIKMAKLLNKSVFISCNLDQDRIIIPAIEKALHEKIKESPDLF